MTDLVTEGSTKPSTTPKNATDRHHIHEGDFVMFRLLNGEVRSQQVNRSGAITLGRLGSFNADELIGQLYGLTHEIVGKSLKVIPPRNMEDVEDTEATNELINDGMAVQPLTAMEIETLKQSGVHAAEIIKKQIEAHANYELKTEYSKDKYKKRKEAKFLKAFTTVEPTLFNVCEYWFHKDQTRIRDLRIDTLSQMINLANIRPGGRYLAVDDVSGLLVSAILDRLGGDGRLLTICDVDSPPAYPVMTQMNFPQHIVVPILASLNWATAEEDYTPVALLPDPAQESIKSDKHRVRMNKRKATSNLLASARQELFVGGFEGLLIASEYEPMSILERLAPYIGGSASVVIYSPHLQPLTSLQNRMRLDPQYLAPSVTESWLRRYQVLPGRTHPTMMTTGSGGYLLHATKM
ncbi:Gcd10p-domain-containing protein [Vararia minispora EC-137]|uniref:Gcd10p-domain-containing protein n=1 Tax=Vararia minispora EC-137 TaxID=1314806 RepID=A0ACB8QQM8_9AGAM|nr:Gcd10p-domain-containing protein [Vararia minispora EC-137]